MSFLINEGQMAKKQKILLSKTTLLSRDYMSGKFSFSQLVKRVTSTFSLLLETDLKHNFQCLVTHISW